MIMSDEEVEARINSPSNLVNVIHRKNHGRTTGATEIPESIRDLISITANRSSERQQEIADTFGVGSKTVSRSARGLVGERLDKPLQAVGRTARVSQEESAHEAALDVLMTTLKQIQPKLLDPELKPKELSIVAANMSKIASNMRDPERASVTNNTQVILFAPPRRDLTKYEFQET
jgi:hypothetical protein